MKTLPIISSLFGPLCSALALSSLLLVPTTALAQSESRVAEPVSSADVTPLSIEQCVSLACQNNQRVVAADHQINAAILNQRSAKALFFPSFSIDGNAFYSTGSLGLSTAPQLLPVIGADGNPTGQGAYFPNLDLNVDFDWIYGAALKLEQPIFMGGKIKSGYEMSKLGVEMARQSKRLSQSEIIVETSKAFADVVRAAEYIKVAQSYHSLLGELLRNVESAAKHGLKSKNDILKVKVKINESELALRRAQNAHRLATMNLCHYIGRPLTDQLTIDGNLPQPDIASTENASITLRPEYILLEQKGEIARKKINMARSELLPQVGLMAQYGYINGVTLNGIKVCHNWNFLLGVNVSIPIFNFGKDYNKLKAAKEEYAMTVAQTEDTNEKLMLDLSRSFNNLDEAQLERDLADSSVASAEENLRASSQQYKNGMEPLSDHLEAQTLWQQALQTQVDARVNYYLRWLDYLKATGKIN